MAKMPPASCLVLFGLLWATHAEAFSWTLNDGATLCASPSNCLFDCADMRMDLRPLSNNSGQPLFKDIVDSSGTYRYSLSPCSTFSEGLGCRNTSVCQVDSLNNSITINVGDAGSMVMAKDANTGTTQLVYNHTEAGVNRTTLVTLVCSQQTGTGGVGRLNVTGETSPGSRIMRMTLTSPHACFASRTSPQPSPTPTPTPDGRASGHGSSWLLMILQLFVVAIVRVCQTQL